MFGLEYDEGKTIIHRQQFESKIERTMSILGDSQTSQSSFFALPSGYHTILEKLLVREGREAIPEGEMAAGAYAL
jgi:hypothetical protein